MTPRRRARQRFAAAQQRAARARARRRRHQVMVIARLDFTAFNRAMREAGEQFAIAARRMAEAARAMRCTAPGCRRLGNLRGVDGRRVCPHHFLTGTGTKRPRGILDAARESQGASGRVSSIAIHVHPPATPHIDPAHLHRAADAHARSRLRP